MKKIKRELFLYSPTDYMTLEEHFQQMAQKGWLVNKIRFGILEYKKIQPENFTFTVDVYPEMKAFQTPNMEDIDSYIKLVEDFGWHYIDSHNNVHIFYGKENGNLIPIQTDEEIKETILNKSVRMEVFSTFLTLLILINSIYTIFPLNYEDLYSNTGVVVPIIVPFIFLAVLIQIGNSAIWTLRSKKRIEEGRPIPKKSYKGIKWRRFFTFGIISICFLIFSIAAIADGIMGNGLMLFVFVPVILMPLGWIIYKKKILFMDWENWQKSAYLGIMILFVFSVSMFGIINMYDTVDENLEEGYLGFTLDDFNLNENVDRSFFDKEGSLLVPKKSRYTEYSKKNHIRTVYINAINPSVIDYIADGMLKESWDLYEREIIPIEGYKEIEEGYYLVSHHSEETTDYELLIKEDSYIIYLEGTMDFTEKENMDLILRKLKAYSEIKG